MVYFCGSQVRQGVWRFYTFCNCRFLKGGFSNAVFIRFITAFRKKFKYEMYLFYKIKTVENKYYYIERIP